MKRKPQIVAAEWWHFDPIDSMLYCEVKTTNGGLKFLNFPCVVTEANDELDAWLAVNTEKDNCQTVLLWKDKELVPEQEIVASVDNWRLRGIRSGHIAAGFTYGIYCAIFAHCRWQWEPGIPNIRLLGRYHDGATFDDSIRLLIPLQNDSVIAISNRNRQYYLHGHPVDLQAILSPKSKHKSKGKIIKIS